MKKFSILIILLTGLSACAGSTVETQPDAEVGLEIQEVTSKSGIKAWLVQDETLPVTAMQFLFSGAGGVNDPVGREGLADLVSSTMDEGAGDLDSQAFQGRLKDLSINLRFNAGRENFGGSFYSLNRYRDEAVEMLRLSLNDPRFDEEPVERIRNQILVGLEREKNDPATVANRTLLSRMFPDHPYGRPVGGTVESMKAVSREDLRNFVSSQLTRDRLFVGVVGDISAAELSDLLDHVFGDLQEQGPDNAVDQVAANPNGGLDVIDMDVPQSAIAFMQPGITRDDPDYYAATVLNHILGGGSFSSRLTKEIREKRGLAYSVYSYLFPLDKAGLVGGGAATQNARAAETVQLLRREWEKVSSEGVSEEEVSDAITYLTGAYPLRFTNSSSIARILVGVQREELGMDYIAKRNDLIRSVSAADVNRVAAKILNPDSLTIIVVGKPEGLEGQGS